MIHEVKPFNIILKKEIEIKRSRLCGEEFRHKMREIHIEWNVLQGKILCFEIFLNLLTNLAKLQNIDYLFFSVK